MKINRGLIGKILEVQRGRDESEKGAQPGLVLGCFYDLKVDHTETCEQCKHYTACKFYLDGFKIVEI